MLKQTLKLLIRLHILYSELRSVLETENSSECLAAKQKWIQKFRRFVVNGETTRGIEAAEKLTSTSFEASECLLDLKDVVRSIQQGTLFQDTKKNYPMLDDQAEQRTLNRNELKAIKGYQGHPMYKCYQRISSELSKPNMAVIAPYYMLHWFIHKKAPKNPFTKKAYKLTDQNLKLNCSLTIAEDDRLLYTQDCNALFFNNLCQWYADVTQRHPEMESYQSELCAALYARCRPLVVKKSWLPIESRPYYKRWSQDDITYQIYQRLDGLFDYSHFPIYAKNICRAEDMLYFFYEKQDSILVKVKKHIRKLINDSVADEYKKLAFLPELGIGNSCMPIEWHRNLAEWMEALIKRDDIVERYVVGDPDPYYPASRIKLSEIKQAITWHDAGDAIYPEDVQPYLSVVEWYIQKCCCERIGDTMRPAVFGLYKRAFLG